MSGVNWGLGTAEASSIVHEAPATSRYQGWTGYEYLQPDA
jgi:hypothetical protein